MSFSYLVISSSLVGDSAKTSPENCSESRYRSSVVFFFWASSGIKDTTHSNLFKVCLISLSYMSFALIEAELDENMRLSNYWDLSDLVSKFIILTNIMFFSI